MNDAATLTVQKITAHKRLARADAGVPWDVYDRGSSGSSTRDWQPGGPSSLNARARSAFVSAFGRPDPKTNPVWVLLMLGTNDVRSDNLFTAEEHQRNVQAIAADLVAGGYNVVINHAPAFDPATRFNGVTWNAASLALLQSYLPGEKAVVDSFGTHAPGRVFSGGHVCVSLLCGAPRFVSGIRRLRRPASKRQRRNGRSSFFLGAEFCSD